VAHGERQRHNAADQERAMCSGPKSKATGPSWVYDGPFGNISIVFVVCRSLARIGTRNCQFGWLRGSRKLLKRKDVLVAGACNHPNCLVLPFRFSMIRVAA
jgi:hypothetical protein